MLAKQYHSFCSICVCRYSYFYQISRSITFILVARAPVFQSFWRICLSCLICCSFGTLESCRSPFSSSSASSFSCVSCWQTFSFRIGFRFRYFKYGAIHSPCLLIASLNPECSCVWVWFLSQNFQLFSFAECAWQLPSCSELVASQSSDRSEVCVQTLSFE